MSSALVRRAPVSIPRSLSSAPCRTFFKVHPLNVRGTNGGTWGENLPKHGYYNMDPIAYDKFTSSSSFHRFLKLFPGKYRTCVGTATVIAASLGLYHFVAPSSTNKPVRTMTPEWREATKAYRDAQNMDPISKFKQELDSRS